MVSAEQQDRRRGAQDGEKDVGLGIPEVVLGTEELRGLLRRAEEGRDHGGEPLDHLVDSAQRHRKDEGKRIGPESPPDDGVPDQVFAQYHRRNESLKEVAQLVIVVPAQIEQLFEGIEQGNTGIAVVGADQDQVAADQNRDQGESAQGKGLVGSHQGGRSQDHGKRFGQPQTIVPRRDQRPQEDRRQDQQEETQAHRLAAIPGGCRPAHPPGPGRLHRWRGSPWCRTTAARSPPGAAAGRSLCSPGSRPRRPAPPGHR